MQMHATTVYLPPGAALSSSMAATGPNSRPPETRHVCMERNSLRGGARGNEREEEGRGAGGTELQQLQTMPLLSC
jgi:hypothetical protein